MTLPTSIDEALLDSFTKVFAGDDIGILWTIIAPDCEWSIMATSEHFNGVDEIRKLIDKVQQARGSGGESKVTIKNLFHGGDHLCMEFSRQGIVQQGFSSDPNGAAAGSFFEIDFCVVAQVRDGKVAQVREYFNHTHFGTPPDQRVKFFG